LIFEHLTEPTGKGKQLTPEASPCLYEPQVIPLNLRSMLSAALIKLANTPIEYYESLLYDITSFFALELGGRVPEMASVEIYHPLRRLQDRPDLSGSDYAVINSAVEDLIYNHSFAMLDYRLISMTAELISGLLVKWNLVEISRYSYRYRDAVFSAKLIDIEDVNQHIISMEVLYFACIVAKSPLDSFIHQTVQQYASMLLRNTLSLFNTLLLLTDVDFTKVPSISGYLAAREPRLALLLGTAPDYNLGKPDYHRLSMNTGLLSMCMRGRDEKKNLLLKERLIEVEMAYRSFESVLIKDLSHLKCLA
jgi:hypothetical protein